MADLWGYEHLPQFPRRRRHGRETAEEIGSMAQGMSGILGTVGGIEQQRAQREMALQKMEQERGLAERRMGQDMDLAQMREQGEAERAQAMRALEGDTRTLRRDEAARKAEEAAGETRARPLTGQLETYRHAAVEPEVAPVYGRLQKMEQAARLGQPVQVRKDFRGKLEDPSDAAEFGMEVVEPGEAAQRFGPEVAWRLQQASQRKAQADLEKAKAGYHGQGLTFEQRMILQQEKQAFTAAMARAKANKMEPGDAIWMTIPAYKAEVEAGRAASGRGFSEVETKYGPQQPGAGQARPSEGERAKQLRRQHPTESPEQISERLTKEGY